jgi:hypothetical protein
MSLTVPVGWAKIQVPLPCPPAASRLRADELDGRLPSHRHYFLVAQLAIWATVTGDPHRLPETHERYGRPRDRPVAGASRNSRLSACFCSSAWGVQ